MQINATFLIQIANFWITYYVLKLVLFGKFVEAIEKKRSRQAKIISLVAEKERNVGLLQHQKNQQLLDFKAYINQKYPVDSNIKQLQESVKITKETDLFFAEASNESIFVDSLTNEVLRDF